MQPKLTKTLFWLTLFAIAMGFLESAVVIYLRELYYPGGFQFPLRIIPAHIANVELWRETATIIMLVGAGYFAGRDKLTRFACFLIAFAVWDLFYYIFLFVFIQWPESLFTWDILFLIPCPWTGPVIAPCLVATGMCFFGCSVLYFNQREKNSVTRFQWLLLLGGAAVIIFSFVLDYLQITRNNARLLPPADGLFTELRHYVPVRFNWWIFICGMLISCSGVFSFILRSSQSSILNLSKS